MQLNVNKISSSNLMLNFMSNTSAFDVKFIGGLNPFTIKVDGEEVYVYIKNLSPAQLSNGNPDVWRIQLPQKEDFEQIKESRHLFLLLGYDADNNVYTTWNPYWCKQRLNVGKSVSLYSRLSLQKKVHNEGKIMTMPLNNEGVVVCLPPHDIYHYIKNFKSYYPEETMFVPKGSSIQKRKQMNASAVFERFCNIGDCSKYRSYLESIGKNGATTGSYIRNLVYIFDTGLVEKYKSIFLQYSNIEDYLKAIVEFKNIDEVSVLDEYRHGYIRTAMNHYVRGLIASDSRNEDEMVIEDDVQHVTSFPIDEFGKLVTLDEGLIDRLYPLHKDEEFPDYEEMMNIAADFYPNEITDVMTPVDWIELIDRTKWKKSRKKKEPEATTIRTRRANKSIRITTPDGDTIQESSATETYLYIFEHNYPDLIVEIDFGDYVIAKEKMPDYPNTIRHQSQLSNGYFVSTNFDTETKAKILRKISDELDLDLKVEVVTDEA